MRHELPEGLVLRPLTVADLPSAQALLDACETADAGVPTVDETDLALEIRNTRFDLANGAWAIAAADGALAGVGWILAPGNRGICRADHYVRPDMRRLGLDEVFVDLVEARAADYARDPARVGSVAFPLRLLIDCESVQQRRRELLLARGFAAVRETFEMRLDLAGPLPPVRYPDGFVVRAPRFGEDDRLLYEADEEAFGEHFGHQDKSFQEWRLQTVENEDLDPGLWLVAWDGAEVAGQAWALPREDQVVVDTVAVREPWRGRGLGSALLQGIFALLAGRGYPFARLFVDSQNETGALGLYRKAGMRVARRFETFEKTFD
jgi:mycothiol synthase